MTAESSAALAALSAATPPTPRLLLVDDDRLLRGMASRTLNHAGFDVVEVDSGEQALERLAEGGFDLVLLDVMMDGIDGFETCRQLRAAPATAQVPVLMLTGLNDTASIEQSYQAGATDFITKPIHWALLPHRVRYALRAAAARAALERSLESLEQAQRQALHDSLTGLPNRQRFLELAAEALERARRSGAVCAVLHLDLDQFRSVNDALGRAGGDRVLRTVAERLQARVRATDLTSVGGAGQTTEVVARIGPNSFTLMLVDIGHHANAGSAAERLIREVERPILVGGHDVVLTAGVGIAVFPRDGATAAELSANAEQALYAAKRAGRSQHRFFDEALNAVARDRLVRETALRHAIEEGQLRLHFQPKVDARDGRILGAEALVRWQHPELGLVMPGEFIPLAEETGLILPLTDWVLKAACAAVAGWPAGVPVSVNVASPSFMADGLLARLDALVRQHGIAPSQLMVEVTESMLMAGADAAIARLEALRAAGYKLSLDDFGTGFSSLSYVKRFPIDELKIDRAFVKDVDRGGRDMALVASIITLARLLDLQVVAEGVETAAQARHLCDLGCHIHQGYWFARPMAEAQLLPLLAHGRVTPAG